ncbi:MAG: LssY C-terminal domain-containing protein [Candidatus Shapirobacteria bacterium]|nr:LssY C-terminal domain-containing protein [Candidatus Shapirobacteria bacterium]MDD4410133.1 LssY C-terminal domain-containing protein [Candidatus Shapirobacteria bacterium]
MKFLIRWLQRLVIGMMALIVIWFISTQIYERLEDRLSMFLALVITYLISAYIVLPVATHLTLMITRKGKIPRFTRAADGLYVDPVNIIFDGTRDELENVFKNIGWYKADKLTIKSGIKMFFSVLLNKAYLKAPFGLLFLFGRKQDIGFQKAIGNSPKRRHHIRFWATNTDKIINPLDIKYWTKKQKINRDKAFTWIGAGSEDMGIGFKKISYQITHRVDPEVDEERDYILSELKKANCIGRIKYYKAGAFKVGKYVSDGKIAVVKLKS